MNDLASNLMHSAAAVAQFGACTRDFLKLSDGQVLELTRALAAHERQFGAFKAHAAAEVARRSRRELGHSGLAAREGFASAEKLIESVTRISGREAAQLVSLGKSMDDASATQNLLDTGVATIAGEPVVVPWDAPITAAVATGALSVDCASALRRGLGGPTAQVSIETLRELAARMVGDASDFSADRAYKVARLERDLIDSSGVKARQQELYERGGFRMYAKANGMYGFAGEADPESAAVLSAALDPLTSPRRGGPRFIDPADQARAQAILDDPRTTDRITLDGLIELVKVGASTIEQDPAHTKTRSKMYGRMGPVVTIIVRGETITDGSGFGILETDQSPLSPEAVAAAVCSGDTTEVIVSKDGSTLDLGRTKRLYDQRQRVALAVRDGGCLWPGCTRPPGFTEAHHTKQWKRDHGKTNLDDGVLLCRFHHMQLHNNGWEIKHQQIEHQEIRHRTEQESPNDFWLYPPPGSDPNREPVRLPSKNPLFADGRRTRAG
ncbi:MAG: DUF222 domain-containing protein [Terrimesophilobacter sp.]